MSLPADQPTNIILTHINNVLVVLTTIILGNRQGLGML